MSQPRTQPRLLPAALPEPTSTPLRGGPTVRWGVLAPGVIADAWTTAVHMHTDQRVAAVASRDLEKAQRFAERHGIPRAYGDYEQLVADPKAVENTHSIIARGAFGTLEIRLQNRPLATNPKSSEMTALNLVRLIENRTSALVL